MKLKSKAHTHVDKKEWQIQSWQWRRTRDGGCGLTDALRVLVNCCSHHWMVGTWELYSSKFVCYFLSMEFCIICVIWKGGAFHIEGMYACLVAQLCQLFATPWTVVRQALLSMGFSRQEHWNGLPYPPPGDLPNRDQTMSPMFPAR